MKPSMDRTVGDYGDGVVLVVDSTGLKVYNRGEWIRELYGAKMRMERGFVKMHVSLDTKSRKIISLRVTDGRVRDHRMFKGLVGEALERCYVERVLEDKGYYTREIFNYLDERSVDPGIRVRRNASEKSKGSPARERAVIEQENYDEWRGKKGYGYRWLVESAFPSIKRIFGEHIASRKTANMIDGVAWKTQLYNRYMQLIPPAKT